MGTAMIHMLEEKFQELGFQPSWLNLSHAAGRGAFIAVLDEAVHQQRSSHAAFTHRLLQLAQAQGWLKKTSAAVNLSPWDEIHRLWQQVEQHPDPTIQAKGRDGIRKHSQQTAEALQLQAALIAYCRAAGWKPQHLGVAGSPASIGLDQALLEIIECRDRGATQLSQKLIEQCERLVSSVGEASGVALAQDVLTSYAALDGTAQQEFFTRLAEDFDPAPDTVLQAAT